MMGSWVLVWDLCLVLVEYCCLTKVHEDRVVQAVKEGVKGAVGRRVRGAASGAATKMGAGLIC